VEALVPKNLGGRDLHTWSLSGRCWVVFAGPVADQLVTVLEAENDGNPIDLDVLGFAVAGRDDGSGRSKFVTVASQPLGTTTVEAWIEEISTHAGWGDTCAISSDPVTVDGVAGVLVIHCPDDVPSALVVAEGRGYLIVGYAQPSLEAFLDVLATVQLSPEDVVDP
jgi:hypothetical protein